MQFTDFLWTFLFAFLLIAYLMIFFSIITDLFRDHTIGGGAKALWVIFLIVLPFLAALIYLIARGNGMAQRQQAAVAAAKKETDDYIKQVAGTSTADELAKAQALKDSGAITATEFATLKKNILAGK
ncbi:SHOCT domain-containing protein [Aurantimicrobium minutum]|uniref:SHOCT domain-containing protein n=1 Tax=Aurantimicrobium minutum TaxID=708131 RepID=UPI0024747A96|nr:SHOCT domain-containing protein [Aurantimicrobium minutum]MDH6238703.1 ABC-type multidrug transport system fused ATPase/permease subunit [Aurantimicrobium minutum]